MPTIAGIKEAVERIGAFMAPTPLVRSGVLSHLFGLDVFLKIETTTLIGSFKLRGALNCVLAAGSSASMIVSSSTGNHGQGVAYAARLLGKSCTIFLPENPHPEKRRKIELLGARTVSVGRDYDVAKEAAQKFAAAPGCLFVDDGEDPFVMEGAGTIGWEIGEALEQLDTVVVPMGGGNLVSGTAVGVKARHPRVKVVAVQSESASAMHDSFLARHAVEREVRTVAECLAQRVPAALALRAVLEFVDDSLTVADENLFSAAKALALYGHLLAEPGAAAGLAALAVHPERFVPGSRVVVVVTGANLDSVTLSRLVGAEPIVRPRDEDHPRERLHQ
jgi:threonine dehydratase